MKKNGYVEKKTDVVLGIGSALVDIIIKESDAFLTATKAEKGGMHLVDNERIEHLLRLSSSTPSHVPGGSACNTMVGIGRLGGRARFIGKRGDDVLGRNFEETLKKCNVEPLLFTSSSPTGRVLSIVTPDTQRSMFTFLGASSETDSKEIQAGFFQDAAIVHIEGYLVFNQELMSTILAHAKRSSALISLDLASFTVVEQAKQFLKEIIPEYVDILIANEDEGRTYTGFTHESDILDSLKREASLAVLKCGKRGSMIAGEEETVKIGIVGDGSAVDTTGAGDLWASGFLFGLVKGYPLKKCAELGALCGYEVCQVIGAHIPQARWSHIKELLK